MINNGDGTFITNDGKEKWVTCPICQGIDMDDNMFRCETCGKRICDDCCFSSRECSECFNK